MLRRREPAPIAGNLVGAQQCLSRAGDDVELDHPVRIATAIRLALDRHADEDAGPRMLRRRDAPIHDEIRHVGQLCNGRRVAGIAVVIHETIQHAGGALTDVAVVPVAQLGGRDHPVGVNRPGTVENVMRPGGYAVADRGPRVTLQGFRGEAHPPIALAVQPVIPRRNDAVRVLHRFMPVVTRLDGRRRKRCDHQENSHDQRG